MMEEDIIDPKKTDKRIINLVFDFPFTFRHKCVYTQITQLDLIKIIRQVKDSDLSHHLKGFIKKIDEFSYYSTDIDNQKIDRHKLTKRQDREVHEYDESKINKEVKNE